jgi:uncharacterized protein (TIGR03089 family)
MLDELLRSDGARPLLTWYDLATGERVELSVTTTDNWVAKTANLLQDSLAVSPGARIAVHLPLHWQAVVWALACWRAGCVLVIGEDPDRTPLDVAVVQHPATATDATEVSEAAAAATTSLDADEVVALALLPMGRPSTEPLPTGLLDYDAEILGHGDRFVAASSIQPDYVAVEAPGTVITHAELLSAVGGTTEPQQARLLLTQPPTAVDALPAWLAAVAAGGSVVLVTGADASEHAEALAEVVETELVTARA